MTLLGPLRSFFQLCQPQGLLSRAITTLRVTPIARYSVAGSQTTHDKASTDLQASAVLTTKKRFAKKKTLTERPNVLAYATCEEYNLDAMREALSEQGLYETHPLPEESNAIHARAKYIVNGNSRDIFFFEEGSVVFWNFSTTEANSVLQFVRSFEQGAYRQDMVEDELELMEFKLHSGPRTRLSNGVIELRRVDGDLDEGAPFLSRQGNPAQVKQLVNAMSRPAEGVSGNADPLEMYAFSNGVALSVKLAIWEATLEEYVESIDSILKEIEGGRKLSLTRQHVFRKTGELFALRHRLNLSSDLLDVPDFYWDREDLEEHFLKTLKTYSIDRRTRVMNERIKYCQELMDLVAHHLEDKHHVRLELMIIILIIVEVIFECIHYAERFSQSEQIGHE